MRYLCFLILLWPFAVQAQNYPANTSLYINDFADLIDAETEARIVESLKAVKSERGVEMTVVTIESRLDYGPSDAIEPFATGLFNS